MKKVKKRRDNSIEKNPENEVEHQALDTVAESSKLPRRPGLMFE
jgi:hypothetical protein